MYRTKKDVDKHVQDINSKIRNASDRNLKGYSIAKLYYQVGDYENARRYVSNYLSEKDTSTVAHKLLGQIYESLKQKDKAVGEYKKAYELDNTQKEIVLKICELLVDLPIDPQRARYWVEIGEKQHPHHDSVYRLREAMLTQAEGDTSPKLEEVLAAELVAKPTDVILRMRLVRLYQRSGRIQEGWDHVMQVENRMPWPENKDWYSCISELAENYQLQFRTKCGHQFYIEYISCLDRLVELEFRAGSAASGAAEVLHKMDQALHAADQLPAAGQPGMWPPLMAHFRGQLYLAAATLLFRRAQKEVSVWKENNKLAGALLLASWGIREVDCSREDGRRTHYWRGSGSSRRSQAGHILLGMAGKQGASVYQERLAGLATTNTQDKIYNAVFVSRDQRAGIATSCLGSNEGFVDLVARTHLPSLSDLASTDEAMAALKTEDLHHLVWVGLRYYRPGKVLELGFRLPGIDGLSQEGGKDPLSQLDMDAFLYATVYVTGWQVEQEPVGQEAAPVLPVAITASLATEAQEELWRVAIKSAQEGLAPQERRVLQHGLDTIRAVGLHGLDLHLAMKLAKTFECHALEAKATADCDEHASRSVAILEARAATYYKCALQTIEKQDRGVGGRQPQIRLFSPAGGDPTTAEVTKMKEGAKFFLACQKMHQDLHEEALAAFGELRTPYASFYTAEIYKKLANEQLNNRPGQIQGDVSGRYGSLLREAQEALYRTLDRLKAPGEPAGHPLNQQLPECIEELENLLAGVGVNGDEDVDKGAAGTPRRVQGVTRLEEELTSTPNMARSLFGNQNSSYVNSPMRTEARPSPERLDAQVRNLATTQEGVMKTLMEQNTIFVESNKAILEELKNLNVEITKLRKSSESTAEKMSSLECATIAASDKAAEAIAAAAKAAEASAAALTASASAQPIASSVAAATAAANMQQAFHAHQQLNMQQAVNTMENYQFTGEEQQLLDSFGYGNLGPQYGMYGQMSPFAQQMYTGAQMSQQQQQLAAKAVAMRTAQQQQQQQQQQQVYSGMYGTQAWTGTAMQQPQPNLQLPTVPTSVTPSSFSQHLSVQQKNTLFAQMGTKPSQTGTPSNTPQEGTSLVATPLASGQVTPTQAASKPGLSKTVPAANVVITKSDKIPTTAAPTTVTMSVTIPPQHRLGTTPRPTPTTQLLTTPTLAQSPATPISAYKTPAGAGQLNITAGTPHGFQIPMPDGVSPITVSPFAPEGGAACPITTTALLSSIAPPAFSAVTPSPDKSNANTSKLRNPSGGATPTLKQRQPSATDDGDEPEPYEPEDIFKPVIPLPAIVDVVTGEEDETILFEERAKLFRYADDSKEWKERGLGQAKLLHNTVTGNVRFIMRREQTFKICANHNIAPEMKMDPMKGNAKARIWGAVDFADEERRTEKFCIKFKTEEQAQEFNVKFEMAKTMSKEAKDKSSPKKSDIKTKTTSSKSLADFAAAQKSSSWECSQCLVRNDMAKIQCMSCESAKPGHEDEVKKLQEAAKPAPPVMTIGQGGGFKFSGPAETGTSTNTAPASGFMFGSTTTKPITTQTTTTPATGFTFGNAGTKTTETDKSVTKFGGFSFTNDPVVQKEETKDVGKSQVVAETKTTETTKPSPFSGFSFTPKVTESTSKSESSGSTVESISTPVKSTDATDSNADLFGSKVTSGLSTFGNVATGSSDGIKSDPNFKGFAGAGSQLFGSQTKKDNSKTEDDDEAEDDFVPAVDFKPVIPLPALIEVKTGEEGEKKLFCERVKLYRFVQETKEWKERGIGEFKILKNEETGKVRLLMRREQVHKICCNHALTPDLEFSPLQSSDKAWTWSAPDFSEGEIVNELFAVKFKNVEMATNWIDIVKDCQKELKENPATSPSKTAEPTLASSGGSASQSVSLADFAKSQKARGWECEQCLVRNDSAKIQCMSCESPKPGHEEEVKKLKEAAAPAIPVMTMGEGGGFKFSSSGATAASSTASSGFVFGTPEKAKSEAKSGGGFQFGNTKSTSGFSFVPTPTGAVTPTKENSTKWSFGSPEKKEFAFSGVKPPSPRKHTNSVVSENEDEDGLYKDDDEGDDLYFAPVIPLPPQVQVKTGEEEEEVLYSHRAKLFRYIDGEWKERGVGDVKILKNKSSKKIRLLMRRDQVLKICLNHYATTQLVSTFKEKDTKSWTWAAQDFSDGELTSMTFALRFKSPDIAKDFKETLDVAVADCETGVAASPAKETSPATTCTNQTDKQKNKSPSTEKEVVVLFNVEDYTPPPHVENEVEVSFHGQGLKLNSEEDAAEVAAKIGAAKTMHILTLSGNTVGIEAAKAIGKSLEGHSEFRRAHWKDMFTGRMKTEIPPALIHLSNGVMTARARLVELDLSDNAFGPIGMEGIKTLLASPSCFSLKILKLNNTGCGVTGGKALAATLLECYHKSKAIGHPLALEVFVLGRSRQENEGGKALAEVFKLMGSLREVVMPQNGIYHDGLTALADAFSNNPNLRHLDMNDNTFTEKGARPMAAALSKLKNLEYLNLGDCLLKSAGATLIARALKNNHPNLKELILDSNEIRTKGLLEIIEAIADKNHLEKFSVDVNQLGDEGVHKMKKRLTELGKLDVLSELEENQDPDSDEEDPDLEDEPEYESTPKTDTPSSEAISNSSDAKSTFTFATPSSKNAASIFGGSPSTSIFGGNSSSSQVNIFGGSPTSTFKPSGNLFGASPSKDTVFGKASDASSTVADSSTEKNETEERKTSFLFGGAGGQLAAGAAAPSIFAAGISSTPGNSLFGTQQVQPATKQSTETPSANLFGSGSNIFGSGSGATFSFSSLGSSTGEATGIAKASEDFKFKGAGATVFGSKATPKKDGEESDGDDVEEDSHDPHFEPIVPLPELVTVTTGEEGQQVIFKHRAKVYRFDSDTKQWKERGVGDIKILKAETFKYRVLLRRDQIHKIACNHLIQADIELKPLSNSETAWCWYAMDFSEDEENGKLEHLAVRFKTIDTAKEFKSKFVECQEDIKSRKNKDASVVEDAPYVKVERAVLSPSKKPEEETAEEEEDVEDDEDYECDEDYNDLETIMFQQQAFLSQKDDKSGDWIPLGDVDLRILYDDDVYGARIVAEGPSGTEEEDNTVCNHLIAMQTNLSDDLTWSALDFSIDPPNYRTFKAQFESDEATSEFRDMFAEGKDLAEQSEILEQPGGLEGDPQDFYYGVGGDDEGQDS